MVHAACAGVRPREDDNQRLNAMGELGTFGRPTSSLGLESCCHACQSILVSLTLLTPAVATVARRNNQTNVFCRSCIVLARCRKCISLFDAREQPRKRDVFLIDSQDQLSALTAFLPVLWRKTDLFQANRILGVRPRDEVSHIGFEIAEPVRHTPGNNNDITFGDMP